MVSAHTFMTGTSGVIRFGYYSLVPTTLDNMSKHHPQLELGSVATPYVPYGHVGLEVQSRNLWGGEKMAADIVANSTNYTGYDYIGGNYVSVSATRTGTYLTGLKPNTRYTVILSLSKSNDSPATNLRIVYSDGTGDHIVLPTTPASNVKYVIVFTTAANKSVAQIVSNNYSGTTLLYYDECGLFEGVLTVDDFEPYFHTTTPIPLPERGWVGGLPDGTSDVLSIDSAGKVEWEKVSGKYTIDGSGGSCTVRDTTNKVFKLYPSEDMRFEAETTANILSDKFISSGLSNAEMPDLSIKIGKVGTDTQAVFVKIQELDATDGAIQSWISTNPVTVLYPLATPVTESLGYIDLPDIPSDATVSIPELENLGVKWWLDSGAVVNYHKDLQERLEATNLAEIEDAVGDLAALTAELIQHDTFYFGFHEYNGEKYISVFRRSDT